jgi:hypothetical protein
MQNFYWTLKIKFSSITQKFVLTLFIVDFNNRNDNEMEFITNMLEENRIDTLPAFDQMKLEVKEEGRLKIHNSQEGTISFKPTYNITLGTDNEYIVKKLEKRLGSTDRIL